jgi:hypothetical protein
MGVPDHRHIVQQVFAQGTHSLTTKEGAGRFTEIAAVALHAVDANWGHLRKPANRTHAIGPDGQRHAIDVVLYRSTGAICDILRGAGDPDAGLAWGPGPDREYNESDWYAPGGTPAVVITQIQMPPIRPYWGDEKSTAVARPLFKDYQRAGQAPNDGMGVWIGRTMHDVMIGGEDFDSALARHRREWCAILGIPVE